MNPAKIHQRTEAEQIRLGERAIKLRKEGLTWRLLSKRLGASIEAVRKWVKKAEVKEKMNDKS